MADPLLSEDSPAACFAALLRHHMAVGTRPSGKRGSGAWSTDALVAAIGVTRRTIDNYRNGSTLPPDATPLADLFFGDDPRHAVKRHAFLVAFATATGTEPPPWAAAISNVPIREPEHFLGRDEALSALRAAFARKAGRVAITALHGLRGVGKTTLAAAYAERHRTDYRATWWIRAETETALRTDLVSLGLRLGWVDAELEEERAYAIVMERLRDEGDGLLLIYDNATNARRLEPNLPRGGAARILVTSNAPDWRGVADPLEIAVWPATVGADYLIARTGPTAERAAAEALSGALGGLPLAHEQAAAYCEQLEIPLADYARRFAARTVEMLGDPRFAPAAYHDGRAVAKTFSLAIEAAADLHPAAEPLLAHLALLAAEPVPLFLLREGYGHFGAPLEALLAGDGLDEALAALRAFALVGRETVADERTPEVTTETVQVHRLVREVAAARLTADLREEMRRGLVQALNAVYPGGVYNDPAAWPRAQRLDGVLLALLDAGVPEGAELAAAWLLDRAGAYRQGALGAYEQAGTLLERALALRETALGPENPGTAASLNNLAVLYRAQGRLEEAEPLYARARAICEKAHGPDHPSTARSLNNLATLYLNQGRLAAAAPLLARALAIWEKAFGSDHPSTASSLNNLASLYRDQGRLEEAAPLFARAVSILEKALGPDHPDTASVLNNLASLYWDQGRLEAAAPLFARALSILEKTLGPDHPETAVGVNNLALLYRDQGLLAEAVPLFARALAILEKALGPDHPATATGLNNLALLYQDQGRLADAAPLYARALAILETALGPDHPDTAGSLNNLAGLYRDQGRLADAAPLLARAVSILETALGPDHPNTTTFRNNLSVLNHELGQSDGG